MEQVMNKEEKALLFVLHLIGLLVSIVGHFFRDDVRAFFLRSPVNKDAHLEGDEQAEDIIDIPCQHLKDAIRSALELTSQNITASQMLSLTALDVPHGITDLTGISYAKNLTFLDIHSDSCAKMLDLSPLKELTKLRDLSVHYSRISGMTVLQHLTGLERLNLSGNEIADIAPLQHLERLRELNLSDNAITDISLLDKLSALLDLDLNHNQIIDITPLQSLEKLETLDLSDNAITDISPLDKLSARVDVKWTSKNG